MTLSPGARLGHYEVMSAIGAGGMGEVYRALDTHLGRHVAIKILPDAFAHDPERLARFEREAKTLASLNHPNIAQIYGVENADGVRGLVMELVEGETLADCIARGPIQLDEALPVAGQIAEALEAAHEHGIVHRDLKPANIKLRPDGVVKVLDFGLAKALEPVGTRGMDATASPTITSPAMMTGVGVLLGTAAYMSPEQATGKAVDKRADIWSFGVVLWQMLTGSALFTGETVAHTLADVLRADIDVTRLPPTTPAVVRHLLRRCLERDVKRRLRDIGEARIALETARRAADVEARPVDEPRRSRVWMSVAAALAIVSAGAVYGMWRAIARQAPEVRLSAPFPEKTSIDPGSLPTASPNGQRIAYSVFVDNRRALWLRDLNAPTARLIPGTDNAIFPFWSPDGRSLGFFADGKLKRIDLDSGLVRTLCDAPSGRGGTWSSDDVILFAGSPLSGLARVAAQGGETVAVTTVAASEIGHRYPSFLPDGHRFLYLAKSADLQTTAVYVGDLDTATRVRVPGVSSNAVYSRLGYLFFVREQTILAQRFDASSGRILGEAIPLAQGVDYFPGENEGMFSVSVHGDEPNILAYTSGWFDAALRLTWFDPEGNRTTSVGSPGAIVRSPRLSAAGDAVAFERLDAQTGTFEIWIHDLNRGTDSPFTADGRNNVNPVWSPDGGYLAFASFRGTPDASTGGLPFPKVFRKSTTGVVAEELLHDAERPTWPTDWSRDGRYIVETIQNGNGQRDIWLLPLFGEQKAFPFVDTAFDERDARVSADSRFIAYVSNEGRRDEVFLETFPRRTSRQQVSTSGGTRPVWSRDGRELYFLSSDQTQTNYLSSAGTLMVASIRQDGRVDPPRGLFKTRGSAFDVARDGRILTSSQTEQAYAAPMSIVLNWPALLRK